MRVYHFLSAENAINDIALRRMKVSRFDELNDPFELISPRLLNKTVQRRVMTDFAEKNSRLGVLCFTRGYRAPILWSLYADKHRGICLGFDIPDQKLAVVSYIRARPDVAGADGEIDEEALEATGVTKDAAWKFEREVRTFVVLKKIRRLEGGMHFKQFNDESLRLREVLLGPRCTLDFEAVLSLVNDRYEDVTVSATKLAKGKFAVMRAQARTGRIT
jgi:hypothetical protein